MAEFDIEEDSLNHLQAAGVNQYDVDQEAEFPPNPPSASKEEREFFGGEVQDDQAVHDIHKRNDSLSMQKSSVEAHDISFCRQFSDPSISHVKPTSHVRQWRFGCSLDDVHVGVQSVDSTTLRLAAAYKPFTTITTAASTTERHLFLELVKDISNDLNIESLCYKILTKVTALTNADRCSLFLSHGRSPNQYLTPVLFDVTADSVSESIDMEALPRHRDIVIPFGEGIAGMVAQTKQGLCINNVYEDARFNDQIDQRTGFVTHSMCCMPILNVNGELMGISQIINKRSGHQFFTNDDVEIFNDYLKFCGIGIHNVRLYEESVKQCRKKTVLSNMTKSIFRHHIDLDKLIEQILEEIKGLMICDYCCIVLLDKEKNVQRTYNTCYNESKEADCLCPSMKEIIREQISYVVESGLLVIYERFDMERLQPNSHIKHSQNLCMLTCIPMKNCNAEVIGALHVTSKLGCPIVDRDDIAMLESFTIFCGIGIHNSNMYETLQQLESKHDVVRDVLSYHVTADDKEVMRLLNFPDLSLQRNQTYQRSFDDRLFTDDQTIQLVVHMFSELGLIEVFQIDEKLYSWVISTRKSYRLVTYHNWRHAFNVTQSMFTMIVHSKLKRMLSDLEKFSLMIACMSHDLDHRGTNNSFEIETQSALFSLYSTSTLEHHHFDQCIMILNSEDNKIAENLTSEQYKLMLEYVENAILSTDLAVYLRRRSEFRRLIEEDMFDWDSHNHMNLLRAMLMTACDIGAICKPWEIQQGVANMVAIEISKQCDVERSVLNLKPSYMMDENRKEDLPKMQVGFIDAICLPIYELLSRLVDGLSPWLNSCLANRLNWFLLIPEIEVDDTNKVEAAQNDSVSSRVDQGASERNGIAKVNSDLDKKAHQKLISRPSSVHGFRNMLGILSENNPMIKSRMTSEEYSTTITDDDEDIDSRIIVGADIDEIIKHDPEWSQNGKSGELSRPFNDDCSSGMRHARSSPSIKKKFPFYSLPSGRRKYHRCSKDKCIVS